MAKSVASGFTISGLLDRNASTRSDYPVERIPVGEIADHPANAAYSMDDAGIAQLARSIKEEGLTDLPLVRKLDDGGWQMVSGHRRKAAYALLAEEDEKYAQIPCRVIRDITDEQSVMLLHAANYFVRSLTVSERAAASRALVRWGHHYNQGVHALNSIKFALDHGRGDLEWVSSKLDECALLLAQVDEGRCEMAGELASLEGRAIVGGD